jgi:polygalacturonase
MKCLVITAVFVCAAAAFGQASKRNSGEVRTVSIKDFGAKGDGAADDTAAIQIGLDAACKDSFAISAVTGAGVSPIVITTTAPHTL